MHSSCRAVGILLLLLGSLGHAQSLDEWLDDTALPALRSNLVEMPRFRGELLHIDAFPAEHSEAANQLGRRVATRILDGLLTVAGLRINPDGHGCDDNGIRITIEATPTATGGRVAIRLRDGESGHFLGGAGRTWQGELNLVEAQALGQRVSRSLEPSVLRNPQALARALHGALRCPLQRAGQLPPRPWFLEPGPDPLIQAVAVQLRAHLPQAFTARTEATRRVRLQMDPDDADRLLLLDEHRVLASVAIDPTAELARDHTATTSDAVPDESSEVSSESTRGHRTSVSLREIEKRGACRQHQRGRCLEVVAHRESPAWALTFLTWQHRDKGGAGTAVRILSCSAPKMLAGQQTWRIALAADVAGPHAAYVLTTPTEAIARRLHKLLRSAVDSDCTGYPETPWIEQLTAAAQQYGAGWTRGTIAEQVSVR